MLMASGFVLDLQKTAAKAGWTLPAPTQADQVQVGTPPTSPATAAGVEHTGEAPRSTDPIIEILWTSSDYTGNATPATNYPPAYAGTPPPFGKQPKKQTYYVPYTGPYREDAHGTYETVTTWPTGQLELMESNREWAQAFVDRITNAEVNWMIGNYPGRLMERVKNQRHAGGAKIQPREVLVEYLAGIFTYESTSIPAFLRVALQGAQPLTKDTAEDEIAASIAAKTPIESLAQYVTRFNQHAREWLVARDALSWPATTEIFLSLPLVNRSEAFEVESLQWLAAPYGGAKTLRRHNWNTPADYVATPIPQLNQVSEMLKWYAWNGWRRGMLDSNRVAGYAFAKTLPDDKFEAMVGEFGVKPTLTKGEKTVALAEAWGSMGTELNQSFMVTVARDPTSTDRTLEQIAASVAGSGRLRRPGRRRLNLRGRPRGSGASFFEKLADGFKKLVTHPKKWFQSLQEEVGKLLETIGKEVRRWGRVPIIGDLFLAATAIDFVFGTVFQELGKALQDHSISAISLVNLADGVARVFDAAGKVTAMIAPFLPPPFNLLAAAIAAISIAAGKGIYMLVHQSDEDKAIDEYNAAQKVKFEEEVAAAKLASEMEAAQQQALVNQAAEEAHMTWWKWAEENKLLGAMVSNASKSQPKTVTSEAASRGRRKVAIAAAVGIPLVSLAVAVMASTRT